MTNPIDKIIGVLGCIIEVKIFSGDKDEDDTNDTNDTNDKNDKGDTDDKNEKPIPGKFQLLSTMVSKEVNRVPTARLTYLEDSGNKKLSEQKFFEPGKIIKIEAGSATNKKIIFEGFVTKKSIKIREAASPVLIVECKDEAVKLAVGENSKYYYDSVDSEIIEQILDNYKEIEISVEKTTVKHDEMVQYHSTDWNFIVSRAEANCQLVIANDGKISIGIPKIDEGPEVPVITNGRNVFDFTTQLDSKTQYEKVVASSWSPSEQKWIEVEGEMPGLEEQGNLKSKALKAVLKIKKLFIKHSGEVGEDELKATADAVVLKSKLSRLIGNVKVEFSPLIKPGDTIRLKKFGDRFDGKIFVTGIRHDISDGVGFTYIQFGLKENLSQEKNGKASGSTGGLLPSVKGLHTAVVTQLKEDPKFHYRVKIKLPIVAFEGDGQWARLALPDAGENRGFFFYPSIGDEVIVGFIDEDPRHPVVLGSLYSKAKKAPLSPTDENVEKVIMTNNGLKIHFNDEKKILTIATKKGEEIQLNEDEGFLSLKDQNNNSIKMDSSGITFNSIGDLVFNAKKDIKLEGGNIQNKAKSKFSAEGIAGAELKSNAINSIKGSVVKIN